jgi:uncharacterized coiled-coil protein SlyX
LEQVLEYLTKHWNDKALPELIAKVTKASAELEKEKAKTAQIKKQLKQVEEKLIEKQIDEIPWGDDEGQEATR